MPRLITSGGPVFNGDSTCTIDNSGLAMLQVPEFSFFDTQQGWFAIRMAPTWAATDQPYGAGLDPRLFQYHIPAQSPVTVMFREALDSWAITRNDAVTLVSLVSAHTANQHVTVVGAWTSALVKIAANGSAFTSLVEVPSSSTTPTEIVIGNRTTADRAVKAVVYWVAFGRGTLSDADSATLNAFGDTDPKWLQLPGNPTLLWTADSDYYQGPEFFGLPLLTRVFQQNAFEGPPDPSNSYQDNAFQEDHAWQWGPSRLAYEPDGFQFDAWQGTNAVAFEDVAYEMQGFQWGFTSPFVAQMLPHQLIILQAVNRSSIF